MPTDPRPTERQLREMHKTIRHIGRAMAAATRAGVPVLKTTSPDWIVDFRFAEDALATASDRLIDAVESLGGGA